MQFDLAANINVSFKYRTDTFHEVYFFLACFFLVRFNENLFRVRAYDLSEITKTFTRVLDKLLYLVKLTF